MAEQFVDPSRLPPDHRDHLLGAFYRDLLAPTFPPAELFPLAALKEGTGSAPARTPVLLTLDGGDEAVAGVVGEWFPGSRTLLVAYLVVSPALRGHGMGSALLTEALPRWHRAYGPLALVAEVEDPRVYRPSNGSDPAARVRLYARLGAELLDLRYVQPEVQPGCGRVRDLLLIASRSHSSAATSGELPAPLVATFLHEYYRRAEGEAYADAEFGQLAAGLSASAVVPFLPLHEVLAPSLGGRHAPIP